MNKFGFILKRNIPAIMQTAILMKMITMIYDSTQNVTALLKGR